MNTTTPPKYVLSVLERIESGGYPAFIVGGCVRDMLLGRRPNDWDVCTAALPQQITALFHRTHPTGIQHGTVTVVSHGSPVEVTTFRTDGDYKDHRRPESVRFIPNLEEDLLRRDFTVNAMAMSRRGQLVDPMDGCIDLERRLIRCVGKPQLRFEEDSLRMLRALRFSAVLGFTIEEHTLAAIQNCAPLSAALASERVCSELSKMLLSGTPHIICDALDFGLLRAIPEVKIEKPELSGLTRLPKKSDIRFCALAFLLKEQGTIPQVESFLRSLRLPAATVKNCVAGCALADAGVPSSTEGLLALLSKNSPEAVLCACGAVQATNGGSYIRTLNRILKSGRCFTVSGLQICGGDLLALGLEGPAVGEALRWLLSYILEHPEENEKSRLHELAHEYKAAERVEVDSTM